MTLASLPDELHVKIAKHIDGEEEHNVFRGMTGSCLRFNRIYTPYHFTNPHIVTKNGCDTKLHQFAQAIERYKEMRTQVKTLTIEIVGQGAWVATPSWRNTANAALSELGPKFQDTMWSRWLVLGSMQQVLALVLLRIPNMKKFALMIDGDTHNFTSYGMFQDLKTKEFLHLLPKCDMVHSKQMLQPMQMDILKPSHAEFAVSSSQFPLPPLVRKISDGPFPFSNITSITAHLHINLLVENIERRELEVCAYLGHLLQHGQQLKAFKAILHDDGDFPYNPLFAPDMESIKRIFRRVVPSDSLEQLEISVDNLNPGYIARMRSLRSLMRFRGLKVLKVPQAALTVFQTAWDTLFHVGAILGHVEELVIDHADSYVNQIGMVIDRHKGSLAKLNKVEIHYKHYYASTADILDVWVALSRQGVKVVRRMQGSKQAQQIVNGRVVE